MEYSVKCDECGKGVFRHFCVSLYKGNNDVIYFVIYFFNNIKNYSDNVHTMQLCVHSNLFTSYYCCLMIDTNKTVKNGCYT